MPKKRHTLLVVDDEPSHLKLFRLALKNDPCVDEIRTLPDGKQALDYLYECRSNPGQSFPSIIFLDIKMAGMSGFQVIRQIRAEAILKRLPVVMLTTSQEEIDIQTSYELGANSFIRKSIDFDVFCSQLKRVTHYWLQTSELPF